MLIIKTFKYKLYRQDATRHLDRITNISCWIYNHCISLHKRYYRLYKKHLKKFDLQKHLTKLKKLEKYKSWNEVPSQAIQDIVFRIDRSYKLFFSNKKKNIKCSTPGFKKRENYTSFTTKQAGYKLLDGNRVTIQKRNYKYWKSRDIEGKIKQVTIKRKNGNWFVYFVCEIAENSNNIPQTKIETATGKNVGFDFGIKTFLTASDKKNITIPLFYKRSLKKLRKLQQRFSKAKKFSKTRKMLKTKLSRLHEKVSNQRNDLHWKLAHKLLKTYDNICFETLDLKSMLKSCQKKINDYSFASFLIKLKYLANQPRYNVNKQVIFVDKYFASSKTCSCCGFKQVSLPLSKREWQCTKCGKEHKRDFNASRNILTEGTSSKKSLTKSTISDIYSDMVVTTCESTALKAVK